MRSSLFRVLAVTTVVAVASLQLTLPEAASLPAADLAAGARSYLKCGACHSPERNRTGPLHCGLLGRVAGTVEEYDYSPAMRKSEITWTPETLDGFLHSPLEFMPGTSMGFAGIDDPVERRNLIAWLGTLNAESKRCVQ